jgi:hypothetical protein
VAPEHLDELMHRHVPADTGQEQPQYLTLLTWAEVELPVTGPGAHRTENSESDRWRAGIRDFFVHNEDKGSAASFVVIRASR